MLGAVGFKKADVDIVRLDTALIVNVAAALLKCLAASSPLIFFATSAL